MAEHDELAGIIQEGLRYARSGEKLLAVGRLCTLAKNTLVEVHQIDPDLEPELATAVDHLTEVVEAAERAVRFLDARLSARINNPHEGGSTA